MNPIRKKPLKSPAGSPTNRSSNGTRIFVKAKTGQKENKVTPPPLRLLAEAEEWYTVSVKEKPVEGRANGAITKLLAEYFKIPRSQIRLVTGATSKRKVFEIKNKNTPPL
ncbi:MAG: DUF167 domain-containing protein [bacterium]|nr:DUF167 domain-containing protein [bacterium]